MSREYLLDLPVVISFEDTGAVTVAIELSDAGDAGMSVHPAGDEAIRQEDVDFVENLANLSIQVKAPSGQG